MKLDSEDVQAAITSLEFRIKALVKKFPDVKGTEAMRVAAKFNHYTEMLEKLAVNQSLNPNKAAVDYRSVGVDNGNEPIKVQRMQTDGKPWGL